MTKLFFVAAIVLTLVIFVGMAVTFAQTNNTPPNTTNVVLDGSVGSVQEVFVRATSAGVYDKPSLVVKKGVPVKFNFSADPQSGCGKQVLVPAFGVNLLSRNGETVFATFLPQKEGKYEFHCGMKMFRGTIEVVA